MRVSAVIYGIFCAVITMTGTTQPPPEPKIMMGTFTEIEKYPYLASVSYDGRHCCGGSLVSDRWILTAAHCMRMYKPGKLIKYKVSVGSTMASQGTVHDVVQVIPHEHFGIFKDTVRMDIGMMQIKGTFTFGPTVSLVKLSTVEINSEDYKNCITAGWGQTDKEDKDRLQELELYTTSLAECSEHYSVVRSHVCVLARAEEGSPCFGDSGGPLMCDDLQIGVVSFGGKNCNKEHPTVYTSIPAYYAWVRSVLRHDGLSRRMRQLEPSNAT